VQNWTEIGTLAAIPSPPLGAIAQPFRHAEREYEGSKWNAHQGDNEGEPTGIRTRTSSRKASKDGF
jgi:hypothetical protein